jgi:hypothetical protein
MTRELISLCLIIHCAIAGKYKYLVGRIDIAGVNYVSDVRKRDWRAVQDFREHFPYVDSELFASSIRGKDGIVTNALLNDKVTVFQYRGQNHVRIPHIKEPSGEIIYGDVTPSNPELDLILRQDPTLLNRHGVTAVVLPASTESIYYAAKDINMLNLHKNVRDEPQRFLNLLGYPGVPDLGTGRSIWKKAGFLLNALPNKWLQFLSGSFFAFTPDEECTFWDTHSMTGDQIESSIHRRAALDLDRWYHDMQLLEPEGIHPISKQVRDNPDLDQFVKVEGLEEQLHQFADYLSGSLKEDFRNELIQRSINAVRNRAQQRGFTPDQETEREERAWMVFQNQVEEVGKFASRLAVRFGNRNWLRITSSVPHTLGETFMGYAEA